MRSSKSRSRNKNRNNNRPQGGNIINRVFDSSGPEGKVRGTPQQIIDKYNQLARDAQLAGDRVALENFQQHAEHYTRMLATAQKEMDARQQQHNNQGGQQGNQQSNQNGRTEQPEQDQRGDDTRSGGDTGQQGGGAQQGGNRRRSRNDDRQQNRAPDGSTDSDVIDTEDESASGLVETPEAKTEQQGRADDQPSAEQPKADKPKRTRTRKKAPAQPDGGAAPASEDAPSA